MLSYMMCGHMSVDVCVCFCLEQVCVLCILICWDRIQFSPIITCTLKILEMLILLSFIKNGTDRSVWEGQQTEPLIIMHHLWLIKWAYSLHTTCNHYLCARAHIYTYTNTNKHNACMQAHILSMPYLIKWYTSFRKETFRFGRSMWI